VCDIGGGSTELISAEDVVSVDVGSVRLRERILRGDPPSAGSVRAGRRHVEEALAAVGAGERFAEGGLVGVAGTITTIAALDAGLASYDSEVVHGYRLTAAAAERWAQRLNALTVAEIRDLGPVAPGRADVIGAGALVLAGVMRVLGREDVTVSERDILDGLALGALG
jgi:exopolyphosphatase/guanosine-5'-triphosphate,3'-diphosphate pyrophosphatase